MTFDWDQWNMQKNFLKHGITNLEAESVFNDNYRKVYYDEKHSVEEERYICIGRSMFGNVLFCVFTFRSGKLRVISIRKANKKEIAAYGH